MRILILFCCSLLTVDAMADDARSELLAFNPLNGMLESNRSTTKVESVFDKDNQCLLISKSTTVAKADGSFENENIMMIDFKNLPINEMHAAHRDAGSWLNIRYQIYASLTKPTIKYSVTSASMPGITYDREEDYFIFLFSDLEAVTLAQQLLIEIINECQQ